MEGTRGVARVEYERTQLWVPPLSGNRLLPEVDALGALASCRRVDEAALTAPARCQRSQRQARSSPMSGSVLEGSGIIEIGERGKSHGRRPANRRFPLGHPVLIAPPLPGTTASVSPSIQPHLPNPMVESRVKERDDVVGRHVRLDVVDGGADIAAARGEH